MAALVAGVRKLARDRSHRAAGLGARSRARPRRRRRRPTPSVEDFLRRELELLYHPVGTCRMGADDDAVVDPELRVRGVEGLRVADASVMPTITGGHTYAPT